MSSSIFDAYAAGEASVFFGGHFATAKDRARARRPARPLAPALLDALLAQNARYPHSATRSANLTALQKGAMAVVTGQQVGLFLGPLYTLHKAASAIRVARALEAEWGEKVVPVFWLQTEDHDLPEIATCHLRCASGQPLPLRVTADEARISIAHRVLSDEVTSCLDTLSLELENLPHGAEHLARLKQHYRAGASWSAAFAGVLAELFADEGLVLIDPRDPALAPLAAPIHARALEAAVPIAQALQTRVRELEQVGFGAAVHIREGSPLSFFHPEGPTGPRYRLETTSDGFRQVGGTRTLTAAELRDKLTSEPGCFSTSALLRPILQDTWFTTAAYIGGPGEIAYFAQLAPVYAAFDVPMPLVVPRARLRLIDEKTKKLLARLGLTPAEVPASLDALLTRARGTGTQASGDELSRRLLESFERTLAELTPVYVDAGAGLDVALEKTRATVSMAVGKLAEKYDKARLHKDQALVSDAQRILNALYPEGEPQERHYGLSYFAAQFGERALIERVTAAATPFVTVVQDVDL